MAQIIHYWQHLPSQIDPIFIRLGPVEIRYYGLLFLGSIGVAYLISVYRAKTENLGYSKVMVGDYFLWVLFGVVLGGRMGYVLFYNLAYYLQNPLEMILPFDPKNSYQFTGISGMSFHGGLLGVIIVSFLFSLKNKINFWEWIDFIQVSVPAGYTLGRLGNFMNGELYGRATSVPWGMYFPMDTTGLLRHPSQLYEAFFEGIFLFVILWSIRKKNIVSGGILSTYLIGYGCVRFLIEFTREPDVHLGYVLGAFTLGQILCLVMVGVGVSLWSLRAKLSSS